MKRRKEIWEALHPVKPLRFDALGTVEGPMTEDEEREQLEVESLVPPQVAGAWGGARPQEKGFAAETASISGETKQSINRRIAIADALGDDLDKVVGTSLDKGVELAALG